MKIDLSICTFQRPHIVETLRSVARAEIPEDVRLRIIVTDNDDVPSAEVAVRGVAEETGLKVEYHHVPGRNISIARNGGLEAATGDWIAFLDDDETVDPGWLAALLDRAQMTGADAVFGPSRAVYGPHAPAWMVAGDFHSQAPVVRAGEVETGHTCNGLLRWGNAPWRHERFDVARGRSGGEDTEFFFRLRRFGARYAIAENAIVCEDVPAARQTLRWLMRRRFRIGQSYSAVAQGGMARMKLLALAVLKSTFSYTLSLLIWRRPDRRAFWILRATMHAGVCAGCLKLRQGALYGQTAKAAPPS